MHADTVTCLASCGDLLVSGSRDQSVIAWNVAPNGLRNEVRRRNGSKRMT